MSARAPCQHIADFYQVMWEKQPCIGYNMLRHGYRAWANGRAIERSHGMAANNLYSGEAS